MLIQTDDDDENNDFAYSKNFFFRTRKYICLLTFCGMMRIYETLHNSVNCQRLMKLGTCRSTASMLEWLGLSPPPTTHRGAVRKDGTEIPRG